MFAAAAAVLSHRHCGSYRFSRSGGEFGGWRRSCRSLGIQSDETSKIPPPRLMVISHTQPESLHSYDLTNDECQIPKLDPRREVSLPPAMFRNRFLFGSSCGGLLFSMPMPFFASGIRCCDIQVTNPFTASSFHLPPPSADPSPLAIKPILFPSSDDALLLLHRSWSAEPKLEFCRSSSSSWTPIPLPLELQRTRIQDCIFHRGRLHVVDSLGSVATFDEDLFGYFDNPSLAPSPPSICHWSTYQPEDDNSYYTNRMYLVESPGGEHLYLLYKTVSFHLSPSGTRSFKVFKLEDNNDGCMWKEVESIGDSVMFVGEDSAMSLPASDFKPVVKPNSIYFADDDRGTHQSPPLNGLVQTGVYCVETDRIELIGVIGDQIQGCRLFTWLDPATS